MNVDETVAVLRCAFAELSAEQKTNVRKHLTAGVRVLTGAEGNLYYAKDGL